MASQTVRISDMDHAALADLSAKSGKSMAATLGEAIGLLKKRQLLEETNAAYAQLRSNPKAWREEQRERMLWDSTLADGLE